MRKDNRPGGRQAKILIVDDHPAIREALALKISRQPDLTVCGEAADVGEALRLFDETSPDAAIIDVALKTGNGIDLIKRMKVRNGSVGILVCSMFSENLYAERALRAGALGYITKDQATENIVEALRRVLEGKIYLSEPMAERLLRQVAARGAELTRSAVESLSDRELEVFRLIGQGLDTREVAESMRLSPKTIETYRARMKQKMNLGSHAELVRQAVAWVMQNG